MAIVMKLGLQLVALGVVALSMFTLGRQMEGRQDVGGAWASWVRDYQSFEEMMVEPNSLVVVGVVSETLPPYLLGDGVPFTDAVVSVKEVLQTSQDVQSADKLTVRQTGARSGERQFEIRDARLLREGEEVLLFLQFDPVFAKYVITGGKYGLFGVAGDRVNAENLVEGEPLNSAVKDRDVDDVKQEIAALAVEIEESR